MSTVAGKNLVSQFIDQFDIMLALTPEQLKSVYRIRYDVYCQEFQYEPKESFPDGLEYDKYDEHSVHCLIVHQNTQLPAACIRLIMPPDYDLKRQLPFEMHCDSDLSTETADTPILLRSNIAEYSRNTVHTAFRKPQSACVTFPHCQSIATVNDDERRCFSLLHIALLVSLPVLAELTGRIHNFGLMEPRIARLLRCAVGFNAQQVSQFVEHHGLRAAYHMTTDGMMNNLKTSFWELYDFINARLSTEFAQADYDFFTPVPAYGLASVPQFGLSAGPFNSTTLPSGSLM